MSNEKKKPKAEHQEIANSLSGLATGLTRSGGFGSPVSSDDTLYFNLRYNLISNDRQLLSQLYTEIGIVQTLVDQPPDDAFRAGYTIKTNQLSPDEIEDIESYLEKNNTINHLIQAYKWARLYGGGGVLILTAQDPATPLNVGKIKDFSELDFRAVDLWELYTAEHGKIDDVTGKGSLAEQLSNLPDSEYFFYYGRKIHSSRVITVEGKQATSFVRTRLRGWGMSEVERLVRPLNQYLKNQSVIFELLDEAKIDIYKIEGLNEALLNTAGTSAVQRRIEMANIIKNFNSALVMDKNDVHEQKQINFAGLGEMLNQIRQGLAADLKMPITKLFGVSSAGFNSGEDDIENYNSMIESEIRMKAKHNVVKIIKLVCQKLFGIIPDDLTVEFKPLRVLSAEQEENVKNSKFNRLVNAVQLGIIEAKEAREAINKDNLLPVQVEEKDDLADHAGLLGGRDGLTDISNRDTT